LALVFTTDESSLEIFAQQDSQIIDSLELLDWPTKLDADSLESVESAALPSNTKK
jgi:hypothetical protein